MVIRHCHRLACNAKLVALAWIGTNAHRRPGFHRIHLLLIVINIVCRPVAFLLKFTHIERRDIVLGFPNKSILG